MNVNENYQLMIHYFIIFLNFIFYEQKWWVHLQMFINMMLGRLSVWYIPDTVQSTSIPHALWVPLACCCMFHTCVMVLQHAAVHLYWLVFPRESAGAMERVVHTLFHSPSWNSTDSAKPKSSSHNIWFYNLILVLLSLSSYLNISHQNRSVWSYEF